MPIFRAEKAPALPKNDDEFEKQLQSLRTDMSRIEGNRQRELARVNRAKDGELRSASKRIKYMEEHLAMKYKVTRVLEAQGLLPEKRAKQVSYCIMQHVNEVLESLIYG